MGYYESLAKMIEKSGFTLKELSDHCKELGVKVAPSYISKLQTRKQAPASDEINIAIAKVCNADTIDFLYESFVEKAPDHIKELHVKLSDWFKNLLKTITEINFPKDMTPLIIEEQDKLSNYNLMIHCIENCDPQILLTPMSNEEVLSYEFVMTDDSMEPLIPEGSALSVKEVTSVQDGDVIVGVFENSIIVRRFFSIKDTALLIAEKLNIQPIKIDSNQIKILGKVVEFSIKI